MSATIYQFPSPCPVDRAAAQIGRFQRCAEMAHDIAERVDALLTGAALDAVEDRIRYAVDAWLLERELRRAVS